MVSDVGGACRISCLRRSAVTCVVALDTSTDICYCSSQVGVPYHLDVFLAERFKCDSLFLIQSSGVQFVRQWESTLPVDYLVDVPESLHTGGLVQAFHVADAFSSGSYTVEILSGNGQRRFEVKDASYAVPAAPVTPAPPSVVLDGETVYLCPNVTNHTVEPIPTVAPGTPDTIWIDRERGGLGGEGEHDGQG